MWKYRSNARRHCLWLAILMLSTMARTTCGVESIALSAESQKLLAFVPESTVSVFCVDSPFRLWRWDDLNEATAFETATCFTTMLAQYDTLLSCGAHRVRCAVSAIRHIRDPKRDTTRPVVDGPFQSQRCELFLLPQRMPTDLVDRVVDWADKAANTSNVRKIEIVGHKVLEISLAGKKFLVAQLAEDVVCVANDAGFLSEVLQLAAEKSQQKTVCINENPIFKLALSHISPSAKFWGIRLFSQWDDVKDPTSVRHSPSYIGFHDPQAVFVALELSKTESTDVQFYYASVDSIAATERFPEDMKRGVKVTRINSPITVRSNGRNSDYVICSMMLDLNKVIVAGMDEPGVLFLGITAIFGQGMLL